ncbi:MAG: hypothetical protein LBU76_04970 [Azoarcus sp.]|jgi:type IV pilus assembly protein PilY1|nr:hypothetical protein [Azoarcus sp.]
MKKTALVCPIAKKTMASASAIAISLALCSAPALALTVDFPSVPLTVSTAVPPNLLYIHDDSNSMYWSFMPDEIHPTTGYPDTNVPPQFLMSPDFNQTYYSPDITYLPPPAPPGVTIRDADNKEVTDGTLGNAKFTNAWFNGYDIETRNTSDAYATAPNRNASPRYVGRRINLATSFLPTDFWSIMFNDGTYGPYEGLKGVQCVKERYYPYRSTCEKDGVFRWSFNEYLYGIDEISLNGSGSRQHYYYRCKPAAWSGFPRANLPITHYKLDKCTGHTLTTEAEKQNFANWYAYYRTRNYAAKAGVGRAFAQLDASVRVGWGLINYTTENRLDGGQSVNTVMEGVRPYDTARKGTFLKWLYKVQPGNMKNKPAFVGIGNGATPLRRALDGAGRYYDRSSSGNLGPWADDPTRPGNVAEEKAAACRKSYTLLMTDGYWSHNVGIPRNPKDNYEAITARGNQDGGVNYPFKDSYGDTLADVAWYYWNKKLVPASVANKVPKTTAPGMQGTTKYRDGNEEPHMTTFAIGLGMSGSANQNDTCRDKDKMFRAIYDPNGNTGCNWPSPHIGDGSNKLTDLLHAGVNGHGDFFSASNPDEFVQGMASIINAVNSGQKVSSGNIDGSSEQALSAETDAYVYKTSFKPDDWQGELTAQGINSETGLKEEIWHASEKMPSPAARVIFTRSDNNGVRFEWSNLSDEHKNALKGPARLLNGEKVLAYIRGSATDEGEDYNKFRPRVRAATNRSPLGDSPHNTPTFVKYGADVGSTVFLGANDGMLHAFDANTGKEQFAYIPSALIPKLYELTNGHAFYVDGEIMVTKATVEVAENQTEDRFLLTGTLGRGGRGLYGLDVSTPASFQGSDVKWELNGLQTCTGPSDDPEDYIGYIVGALHPATVDGKASAVFGNGYNSCNDKAALGIVDIVSGSAKFIKASDAAANGLAAPALHENPDTHKLSAYAGDLRGVMWKFGLNPYSATPTRLFNPGTVTNQPITAQPTAATVETGGGANKKTFVYFGTGRYFSISDKSTTAEQNIYALIDDESGVPATRNDLAQRIFKDTIQVDGVSTKSIVPLPGNVNLDGKKGWYLPLPEKGERVIHYPLIIDTPNGKVAFFTTVIPPIGGDPCGARGTGWAYAVNAETGGTLDFVFLDINGDGKLDDGDLVDGKPPAGYEIGKRLGGMPSQSKIVNDWLITGGESGGMVAQRLPQETRGGGSGKGRISWREITD